MLLCSSLKEPNRLNSIHHTRLGPTGSRIYRGFWLRIRALLRARRAKGDRSQPLQFRVEKIQTSVQLRSGIAAGRPDNSYLAVLDRAVSRLEPSHRLARKHLYERARQALSKELRSPERELSRESIRAQEANLESAIRAIEAEHNGLEFRVHKI